MGNSQLLTNIVERMEFDDSSADALLDVDLADQDVDRIQSLIARKDKLSDTEQEELALYFILNEFLDLIQTKAAQQVEHA